jgi:hypothetical protein
MSFAVGQSGLPYARADEESVPYGQIHQLGPGMYHIDHRVSISGQAADCAVRAMLTTNFASELRPSSGIAAIIAATP